MKVMTDEKKATVEIPTTFVISAPGDGSDAVAGKENSSDAKRRPYRKHVVFAVAGVATIAIILSAILVGMYFFTEAEKEILKYSIDVNKNTKQDVTSDPNTNTVEYHVTSDKYEMWVIDDFNRDIQVLKITDADRTNCYAVPLNRSASTDPSKAQKPSQYELQNNASGAVSYDVLNTPVTDSSFLGKKAKDACQGISVYWMYPKCSDGEKSTQNPIKEKQKRDECFWEYICYWYYFYYDGYYYYLYICDYYYVCY